MKEAKLIKAVQDVAGIERALGKFLELGLVDRIGWMLFGAKFLVWRWKR